MSIIIFFTFIYVCTFALFIIRLFSNRKTLKKMDGNFKNENKTYNRRKVKSSSKNNVRKPDHQTLAKLDTNSESNDGSSDDQDIYEKVFSMNIKDEYLNNDNNDFPEISNNSIDKKLLKLIRKINPLYPTFLMEFGLRLCRIIVHLHQINSTTLNKLKMGVIC